MERETGLMSIRGGWGAGGGAQHGVKVTVPKKPSRWCGSRKKARRRQGLRTKMGWASRMWRQLLMLKKGGPAKIGIGEGALNSAGGNITGVYERMISEKGCKAEPDCRSGGKGSERKMRKFPAKREGLRKQ